MKSSVNTENYICSCLGKFPVKPDGRYSNYIYNENLVLIWQDIVFEECDGMTLLNSTLLKLAKITHIPCQFQDVVACQVLFLIDNQT